MTCASCSGRVERALGKVPGVVSAKVNLATERATVEVRPGTEAQALVAAVQAAGYTAAPVAEGRSASPGHATGRGHLEGSAPRRRPGQDQRTRHAQSARDLEPSLGVQAVTPLLVDRVARVERGLVPAIQSPGEPQTPAVRRDRGPLSPQTLQQFACRSRELQAIHHR
jgi:copper chaperone CopZ